MLLVNIYLSPGSQGDKVTHAGSTFNISIVLQIRRRWWAVVKYCYLHRSWDTAASISPRGVLNTWDVQRPRRRRFPAHREGPCW